MRQNSSIKARSGSRDGVALLTVLAFILLLTILILSFIAFTRLNRLATGSYSNAVQAQEIAKGGLQDIISDLHSEIVAGSSSSGIFTQNGTKVYVPTTNYTAVPARLGYSATSWSYGTDLIQTTAPTTLMPSLVRVSRADTAVGGNALNPPPSGTYYPNLGSSGWINRASQSSTGAASLNGRYISPARWNKPFLLASCTATIPTPFYAGEALPTAAGSYATSAKDLPDWVYMTRNGSQVCTTAEVTAGSLSPSSNLTTTGTAAASPVVGRYAYVVYDEGALLDANVAGSPSQVIAINTSATQYTKVVTPLPTYTDTTYNTNWAVTGKSFLSFADLGQIPGLYGVATHGSGSNGQAVIDALIAWRNNSLASSQGGALTAAQYLGGLMTYAQNGFTQFQSGTGTPVISDNPLLNRQDLINFFAKIDGAKFNTITSGAFSQALPYLGTFSRAVAAPTYSPPSNATDLGGSNDPGTVAGSAGSGDPGNIYKYNANADTSPNTSPFTSTRDNTNPGTSPGHNPNPDLANVRFSGTSQIQITHYYDNQEPTAPAVASATYTVNGGDPLLQSRFSLAKINWLSQANPNGGSFAKTGIYAAPIQACFGLVWGTPGTTAVSASVTYPPGTMIANGGNACWNYVGSLVGPGGSSQAQSGPGVVIETLDQVAGEGREPNFFELLKAAILSGSLGLGTGPAGFNNGANITTDPEGAPYDTFNASNSDRLGSGNIFSKTFGPNSTVPAPSYIPDIQIIQIGANIIDQFDADSIPTAIYFPYQGVGVNDAASTTNGNAIYGPVDMVYGDENLPDLSKMQMILASPHPANTNDSTGNGHAGQPDLDDGTNSFEGWLQPELWNPHQQPASLPVAPPHNFEIRAYGSAFTYASEKGSYEAILNGPYTGPYITPDASPPPGWIAQTSPTPLSAQLTPGSPLNWTVSTSNIQTYYIGTNSTELSTATGQGLLNAEAGTITFTDGSATSSFYPNPTLLVIPSDGYAGSLSTLTSVSSPLPVPSSSMLGQQITDICQPNFCYYLSPQTINNASFYNHFVGFSTGVISEKNNGSPYFPYYVSSNAPNTAIGAPVPGFGYGAGTPNAPGATGGVGYPIQGNGVGCTSFALGWIDSTGSANSFHPYSFITGAFEQAYNTFYDDAGHPPDGRVGAVMPGLTEQNSINYGLVDPRTSRMEECGNFVGGSAPYDSTIFPIAYYLYVGDTGGIPTQTSMPNFVSPNPPGALGSYPEDWMMNAKVVNTNSTPVLGDLNNSTQRVGSADYRLAAVIGSGANAPTSATYYSDLDGVIRPGDGIYSNVVSYGDGAMLLISNGTPTGGPSGYPDTGNVQNGRRPIILNRPFRSVGELGYVFRDLPFKTLDFFSTSSADAALLDVFSVTDESRASTPTNPLNSVVAGKVNLNNAPLGVIQALLSAGSKKDLDPTYNLGAEGSKSNFLKDMSVAIASQLNSPTTGPNPILNPASLVTQLYLPAVGGNPAVPVVINAFNNNVTDDSSTGDQEDKAYFEEPVRALSSVANMRTWNLMIDIIAQSGQIPSTATSLDNFLVQGEKRYWLHIAIDRYTGKIVAEQLEPVYE